MSVNNVLFSIAEAVPVVGPSIKGALEALYKVLDLIETRYQVEEDVGALLKRIELLVRRLSISIGPSTALVVLISQLEDIARWLESLLRKKHLRYHVLAKSIAECRALIGEYLQECTLFAVIEMQASMRLKEMTIDSITVVDPLGFKQVLPKPQRADIGLVAQSVLEHYHVNPQLHSLLGYFVERDDFQISIDDGSVATELLSEDLPRLESNTTIVMSVVTYQTPRTIGKPTASCPLCQSKLPVPMTKDWSDLGRVFCPQCDRNVEAELMETRDSEWLDVDPQDVSKLLRNITVKVLLQVPAEPGSPPEPDLRHAIDYIKTIKARCKKRPRMYRDFLGILVDYKGGFIEEKDVFGEVSTLFREKPSLIEGFIKFTPEGYLKDFKGMETGFSDDVYFVPDESIGPGGQSPRILSEESL